MLYEAQHLSKASGDTSAIYLACGIDISKASVFVQSHVLARLGLMWLLSSATIPKDKEDLRRYMFPHLPIKPWLEQEFTEELDGSSSINTCMSKSQHELFHVDRVSTQLEDSIHRECYFGNGNCRSKRNIKIGVGSPLDAKSLLFPSGEGYLIRQGNRKVKVKAQDLDLSGKYVMLCCFMVPLNWDNSKAWTVAIACHDLYSQMKNQFEMVIIVIMRDGWTHEKKAFKQFMSAFPSSCLVIPFHAKSHRRRVCKYLGGMFMSKVTLIAPTGNVLFHDEFQDSLALHFVPWYHQANSHPFPFITDPDAALHLSIPSSLEDLLYCTTSDFVFRKHKHDQPLDGCGLSESFWEEKLPVLHLKSKLVGLYVYRSGHLLPWLRKIEQACWQNDKELEIVVVCLPNWRRQVPRWYPEIFSTVLAKQNICWWVAPYNNTASVVLEQLFHGEGEQVIIVGPDGSYVDTSGAELMQLYGVAAYPSTLKHVVKKTVAELSKVNLYTFLEFLNFRLEPHHIGKNVLFYFDYSFGVNSKVYDAYTCFTSDPDAVILPCSLADVPNLTESITEPKTDNSKLSWHVPCVAGENVAVKFLLKFFNFVFPTIVACGKDGKIRSVLAHRLPCSHGDISGDLHEEVLSLLTHYLKIYDDNEWRSNIDMEDLVARVETKLGVLGNWSACVE